MNIDCGDAHSMALTSKGRLYGWGAAACGQLGIDNSKPLPKDSEGSPYQPVPTLLTALSKKFVVAVSCGEAHTLALDDNGVVYSFGANGCGQLGQDMPARFEESKTTPKPDVKARTVPDTSKLLESKKPASPADEGHLTINLQILRNSRRNTANTAFELYPMYKEELSITHFYPNPNMLKSLLPTNVLRIASGGVHNLCVVEGNTDSLQCSLYNRFMSGMHTDFAFMVEGVRVRVHRVVLAHRSAVLCAYFTANREAKELELRDVRYKAFRLLIDYIYLNDIMLLDLEGFDKELIEVYKLAKKYGVTILMEEVRKRLHQKLKGISVEDAKDVGGKKKCKAGNVIDAVTEVARKYEAFINESSSDEHKIVMLPNGAALIIDAKRYQALMEEGIQLSLPEQGCTTSAQRKSLHLSQSDQDVDGQQQYSQKSMGASDELKSPAEERGSGTEYVLPKVAHLTIEHG